MKILTKYAHELRDIICTCEKIGTEEFSTTMYKNKRDEIRKGLYKNGWFNSKEPFFFFCQLDTLHNAGVVEFVREEPFTMSGTKYSYKTNSYIEIVFEAKRYWYRINLDNLNKLKNLAETIDNLAE